MITFENETRLDPMNQRHSAFLENPKDASREEAMDLFCDLFGLDRHPVEEFISGKRFLPEDKKLFKTKE